MTFIYPILAVILSAFIEFIRIKITFGKVQNVSKFVTVIIAVVLFVLCLDLSFGYYDDITPLMVLVYLLYYSFLRLLIYSPLLNVLRGLPILYRSTTTNSVIDKLLNKYQISPLMVINFALLGTLLSGYAWFRLLIG
jgi:hypothetical protein